MNPDWYDWGLKVIDWIDKASLCVLAVFAVILAIGGIRSVWGNRESTRSFWFTAFMVMIGGPIALAIIGLILAFLWGVLGSMTTKML